MTVDKRSKPHTRHNSIENSRNLGMKPKLTPNDSNKIIISVPSEEQTIKYFNMET